MSEPPPSYPVPSGYPPGHPPIPQKYRPSGWWFVLGGGLVVLSVLAAVGLLTWTFWSVFVPGYDVPTDGSSHGIIVETDNDELMLWREADVLDPKCTIIDGHTGDEVDLRPVTSQLSRDLGEGEMTAAYRFDTGSGMLAVTCAASADGSGRVEIGPAPHVGSIVGGLILSIAVPSLLGLFGLATLIVTGIMWSGRPARPKG
jgi:hypothetical protein